MEYRVKLLETYQWILTVFVIPIFYDTSSNHKADYEIVSIVNQVDCKSDFRAYLPS